MGKALIDLVGQRFGRLTVLELVGKKGSYYYWKCKCDCGVIKNISGHSLRTGITKSCGCYHSEIMRNLKFNHKNKYGDLGKSRLHTIWLKMRQRCYNKNHTAFHNYGGRGIKICDEWYNLDNGFINFYNWAINNGYDSTLTIDRIDVNGNYEPSNCRWATNKEQANNTRYNVRIEYKDNHYSLLQLSELLNIEYSNLWHCLKRRGNNIYKLFSDRKDLYNNYENNIKRICS